jgi:hypothetical protein
MRDVEVSTENGERVVVRFPLAHLLIAAVLAAAVLFGVWRSNHDLRIAVASLNGTVQKLEATVEGLATVERVARLERWRDDVDRWLREQGRPQS